MDWWTEVRLAMAAFLDQHGLLAAFVFLLIEEAGVPVPVPGDFLMLILGVRARQGEVPLWQAIVVMEGATVLGSTFLYAAARLAGETIRHIAYGVLLGLMYPILRARRTVRVRAHAPAELAPMSPGGVESQTTPSV